MDALAPKLRVPRLICTALMMSSLVYLGLAFFVAPQQPVPEPGSLSMLRLGLGVAGLVVLAAIPLVRRFGRRGRVVGPVVPLHGIEASDPEEARTEQAQACSALFVSTICGMAMAEAVIVFGFVLAFVSADPYPFLPFFAVGFTAMLLQWPRDSMVDRLMSEPARAAFRR